MGLSGPADSWHIAGRVTVRGTLCLALSFRGGKILQIMGRISHRPGTYSLKAGGRGRGGMAASTSESDRQLLERFVSQADENAFARLVQRHGPMVLGVCR